MARNPKQFSLTMYLSKPLVGINDCLDKEKIKAYKANPIPLEAELKGTMYLYAKKSEAPDWIKYLKAGATPAGKTQIDDFLKNTFSHSGAIALPIPKSKRHAILTFGYGKALVNYSAIEQFFGRNVILNAAPMNQILAIKSQTYEQQARHKQDQASIRADLSSFGLDLENEILQKLTADLSEEFYKKVSLEKKHLGLRMTGYDSITFNSSMPLKEVGDLCLALEQEFESDRYKKVLPEIDSFCPVRDKKVVAALEDTLITQLRKKTASKFHIGLPYIAELEEYSQFALVGLGKSITEDSRGDFPTIDVLIDALEAKGMLKLVSIDHLKSIKVQCISSIDDARNRLPSVYRCLAAEIAHDGESYTLMSGRWYRLDKDFFAGIVASLNKLVKTVVTLDPFDSTTHDDEGAYNVEQAAKNGYHCFDRDDVPLKGRGNVEVCDLLTNSHQLIHVKRYGNSSKLSHLFSQGAVSAEALTQVEAFRDKFLTKVSNTRLRTSLKKAIVDRKFHVVYVILFESTPSKNAAQKIENLPAFSVVNLYKHYRSLKRDGITTHVQLVFA